MGFEVWQEADGPYAGGDVEVQQLIDFTEDTYDLYENVSGGIYPSYDGASATMEAIVRAALECPNAQWDGTSTNYCSGLATDDVVGHEWAHAYTQFNHALIYAYQPGALNESYSDIFGESVDLLNEYVCSGNGFFDNGGVHINSRVPNHVFALLVDGGNDNGVPVTAIGITKALAIYWRAMTVYQDVTSGFADHADALAASCDDLMNAGTDLPDPVDGMPSGEIVVMADCMQVAAAATAAELTDDPGCGNGTLLTAGDAPQVCGGETPTVVFEETFETDLSAWTLSNQGVAPQYLARDWELRADLPAGRAGQAAFGNGDLYLGDCNDDNQSGVMHMDAPAFTMPGGDGDVVLDLDHWVATQPIIDGGNIKVSLDGGSFELLPATAFSFNPYNELLDFSDNPMSGEDAFTGSDPGVPTGSWVTSQVDLRQVAAPGEQVVLRLDFGVDECNGLFGWYVDDVRVLECAAAAGTTGGTDTGDTTGSTGDDATTAADSTGAMPPTTGQIPDGTGASADDDDGTLPPADGSTTGGDGTDGEGADGGEGGTDGGCGCTQRPSTAPSWWLGCVLVGLRRRRRPRCRS
jgi:hypothetical protein